MTKHQASAVSLDDKWTLERGRVVISGNQAIVRALLAQRALDARRGWNTAGFVSGYRGSPLGNLDATLWAAGRHLEAAGIQFRPGVNEELAATAVHGTQQIDALADPLHEGVFAAWYGKGPGVDRASDALKHGNFAGAQARGGVLVYYGDDHGAKSSTVAHHSERAVAASLIPSLYPSNVQELFDYSLIGIALSRATGSWVGIKCITEVAEQTGTIDIVLDKVPLPDAFKIEQAPLDLHPVAGRYAPVREEQVVVEQRLPLVQRFVREAGLDQVRIAPSAGGIGIVTAGKSYGDVRAALALLGLDGAPAAACGLSLYKLGCIWPMEPEGLRAFARGQARLLVVEEKQDFIEQQVAAATINMPDPPKLVGKRDLDGSALLSPFAALSGTDIAIAICRQLEAAGRLSEAVSARRDALLRGSPPTAPDAIRLPFFCSGCPHNRSTRVPDGSVSMTGIGCHTMTTLVRPKTALPPVQMGGEGANWIGISPFSGTKHIFQNLGDGTYFHSGLLAIRASVAAKVNITYKILYNDAVAMTGGQPVDGSLSVADIARQALAEGVARVVVVSDDPAKHPASSLPGGVGVEHRDDLDTVQRQLREVEGCTILIYEQTCAAEKRRRRKRGAFPDPDKRLFIARDVCEGCGDCSVQSTCVSLTPVETDLGRKRAIDQASCNKDYSCQLGFCPSFLTIEGAKLRKPAPAALDPALFDDLPDPVRVGVGDRSCNVMVAGIGGTGVVTVGALLGMAAHIDGLAMSTFDMTGLSQKNGAVFSHIRIAAQPDDIHTQRLGPGDADLLLAFDLIAASAPEAAGAIGQERTRVIANSEVTATAAFQFHRDMSTNPETMRERLANRAGSEPILVRASEIAAALLGDVIGANLLLLGAAVQAGLLPVTPAAIEQAIRLNAVAVDFNLKAFRLGRLHAADSARVEALMTAARPARPSLAKTLAEIMAVWNDQLTAYQGPPLADRYRKTVLQFAAREQAIVSGDALARTVARTYGRLLTYKDEYEVARLLTQPSLLDEVRQNFEKGEIRFNLAPPILGGKMANGRPRKRSFGPWLRPVLKLLASMRGLRGTAFDPFGRTEERRAERRLIADYEALVEHVQETLSPANHEAALALLGAAGEVRGYGPVKEEAIAVYDHALPALRAAFDEPETAPSVTLVTA